MRTDAVHDPVKIYGPKPETDKRTGKIRYRVWEVRGTGADRTRGSRTFASAADAEAYADIKRREAERIKHLTFGLLIRVYLDERLRLRRITTNTAETIEAHLRHFGNHDLLIGLVTPEIATSWYEAFCTAKSRRGKLRAAATHHSALGDVKLMWAWAIEEGYVKTDPWRKVFPAGRKNAGKRQLRDDEARKLVARCYWILLTETDKERRLVATAALLAFLVRLRATEILQLRKRDIDAGGTLLWISPGDAEEFDADGVPVNIGKRTSRRAKREEPVPAKKCPILVAALVKLRAETPDGGLVFEGRDLNWIYSRIRGRRKDGESGLCKEAGVPPVCPQSLRGLGTSTLRRRGVAIEIIADSIGDTPQVVGRSYVDPAVAAEADANAVMDVFASVSALSPHDPNTLGSQPLSTP